MVSEEIEQIRKDFRKQILDMIAEVEDFERFYNHVEVIFMHLGLQYKPGPRTFLETRNWTDSSRKEEYMKEIEEFLEVYIR